jgi:hypothetical protein
MTNNAVRLLVTVVLLAVIHFAELIPLPGVDTSDLGRSMGAIALGLTPFVEGFVVVELLSFVFPGLRRLRRGGILGRRRLNTSAVCVSVGFALIQAAGISAALGSSGHFIAAETGTLSSFAVVTMTLAGGAAFLFVLGKLLSRWGLGNGFCVILAFDVLRNVTRSPNLFWLTERSLWIPLEFVVVLGAVGLLVWRFARQTKAESGDVPWLSVPVFLQGIVPVLWAYAVFNVQISLRTLHVPLPELERSFVGLLVIAVLIAGFSLITSYFFSSPKRLAGNLPAGALLPKGEGVSRRSLWESAAVLVVLGTALPAGAWFWGFHFPDFALPEVVVLVALGFDLVAEWRFRQKHESGGGVACVIELDNVYGACYLQGLLVKNGCDALIRAFRYRSLFFFFGPIFKMELLVPVGEVERAWELIQPEGIEVV